MTPTRWRQVADLFGRAVDLDPDARAALLDQEANEDAELREAVERMLVLDAERGLLDRPPGTEPPATPVEFRRSGLPSPIRRSSKG